jgi:hypothetical protein
MQQDQIKQIQQQMAAQQKAIGMLSQLPQAQQALQQDPDKAAQLQQQQQQMSASGNNAIAQLNETATLEQVLEFLSSCRARAFTLDIETDSTIIVDENAEKQRHTEFVSMLGQLLPQLAQMVTTTPQASGFAASVLKFSCSAFRGGRELDGAIDEFAELMKQKADQPQGDDPATAATKTQLQIEQMKNQRQAQKDQADTQLKAQELQMRDQHEKMKIQSNEQLKLLELRGRNAADEAKAQQTNAKAMAEGQAHQADLIATVAKARADEQTNALKQRELAARTQAHLIKAAQPPAPQGRPF